MEPVFTTRTELLASLQADLDAAYEQLATICGCDQEARDERETAEKEIDRARWTLADATHGRA